VTKRISDTEVTKRISDSEVTKRISDIEVTVLDLDDRGSIPERGTDLSVHSRVQSVFVFTTKGVATAV
jgi:hypothetical protein